MEITLRKYMTYAVIFIFGLWIGFCIGAEYVPRAGMDTVRNAVECPLRSKIVSAGGEPVGTLNPVDMVIKS